MTSASVAVPGAGRNRTRSRAIPPSRIRRSARVWMTGGGSRTVVIGNPFLLPRFAFAVVRWTESHCPLSDRGMDVPFSVQIMPSALGEIVAIGVFSRRQIVQAIDEQL